MHARLTMVMFFVFLIPVVSLSTLGVRLPVLLESTGTLTSALQFGIFDPNSAAAAFVTPKFFAQTMFYSFVFTSAVRRRQLLA
jgi:hypothetical protein